MRHSYSWKWLAWSLGLVCGLAAGGARAEDPPALDALADLSDVAPERAAALPSRGEAVHEVIRSPDVARVSEHIEKSPPSPINERPGVHPPGPNHQWIEGYWEWDQSRKDFVWVTGTWHVPPPGSFWVNSHWRRDEKGWTRVSGFWSGRQNQRADWRTSGPPSDRPEESVGPAPGPDYFFVAGEYVPDGDGVVWKPGFWSRSHPGWEWEPARWVRQSSGWAFQEGHWDRDTTAGGRRGTQPRSGSSARRATIVSTPADSGSPLDDSGPASAGDAPALIPSVPPLTAPGISPDELTRPSDGESALPGGMLPPPLISSTPSSSDDPGPTAGSPTGRLDRADPDASLVGGEVSSSASSTREADGGADLNLPAAIGEAPVTNPRAPGPGTPPIRREDLPQLAPGQGVPPDVYAPPVYLRRNPNSYRRGYNGVRPRNAVPRARGFLNRILPRR